MAIRILSSETVDGNITVSGTTVEAGTATLEGGTSVRKNATGDSTGLEISSRFVRCF